MTSLKLFLFDLDGTLVSTGGAGLRALGQAFKELYGVDEAHRKIDPAGKTDPAIFREILRLACNRDMTAQELETISACYLHHLDSQMKSSNVRALTGVVDFVGRVAKRADVVAGLGTGNLEKGARLKLAPTGLNPHFTFGGFGSDAEERAEVLRHGHRRATEKTKREIPPESVYVIGDTLLDIAAARKAGYRVVAIASGKIPLETLRAAAPDYAFASMAEADVFLDDLDRRFSRMAS